MYTGISVIQMSKIIGDIIEHHPTLSGLYNLATKSAISKYDLLCTARKSFNLNIDIIPEEEFVINPTLNGEKLRYEIDVKLPSWEEMMNELAQEKFYER